MTGLLLNILTVIELL